ncbi:Purine nucleoside phosphorylase [Merluccius polli]|uniref:Purine nucleoside phosphorylase n=1 Tax=Merluccius polli TaxID=89951 RepID=A0AA47MDD7_MERPO|nr:Purine nucleoside phosphorylase [Merluccius polli]
MRCFALSLISNEAVMEYTSQEKANHEEVLENGQSEGGPDGGTGVHHRVSSGGVQRLLGLLHLSKGSRPMQYRMF